MLVPVQSGSEKILRLMRRPYTAADALTHLLRLQAAAPAIRLATHVIVGFPGETDEDFEDTLRMLESLPVRENRRLRVRRSARDRGHATPRPRARGHDPQADPPSSSATFPGIAQALLLSSRERTMTMIDTATLRRPRKYDLFGVQVSATNYDEATEFILEAARQGRPAVVSAHAVHAVVTASDDPELLAKVNRFDIITPDGQPVRWALNALHHAGLRDRVRGPELMLRVCRARPGKRCPSFSTAVRRKCWSCSRPI